MDSSRRVVGMIADGSKSTTITSSALTAGQECTVTLVRDTGADLLRLYVGDTAVTPVTDTTTGSLANSLALGVGWLSGAFVNYGDFEFVGAAVFRSALSLEQHLRLGVELAD